MRSSHREIAKDLWDLRRFSVKSTFSTASYVFLANCRQLDSTIDDYFGRLTKILDAMQECNPSCSCTKCEWNLALAKEQEIDQIRVHEFGLDDGTIRQQLCAQAPTHP